MAIHKVTSIPYGKYCQKFHFHWLESKNDAAYCGKHSNPQAYNGPQSLLQWFLLCFGFITWRDKGWKNILKICCYSCPLFRKVFKIFHTIE